MPIRFTLYKRVHMYCKEKFSGKNKYFLTQNIRKLKDGSSMSKILCWIIEAIVGLRSDSI